MCRYRKCGVAMIAGKMIAGKLMAHLEAHDQEIRDTCRVTEVLIEPQSGDRKAAIAERWA